MATFRERRTKAGAKRVLAEVRRHGYPAVRGTFPTRTMAKEWAAKVEAEMAMRRFLPQMEAEKHTAGEAITRYLAGPISRLSPKGQRVRRRQLEWWARQVGSLSLARLTPARLSEALDAIRRGASGPTANRYLAALSTVLELASREWGWLEANPARRLRRDRENPGRVRFLSDAERKALLAACEASADPRLYPLVIFALTTGARQGELLGLRWQDVDLEAGRAILHRTKNSDRRALSLVGRAGELLREMARHRHPSGYLLAGRRGRPDFPARAWESALRAASVEDFRFHDLRHTAASYLAMSGASLPELAAFLGHRSLASVSRYAHLSVPHSEQVARRMAERYLSEESARQQ